MESAPLPGTPRLARAGGPAPSWVTPVAVLTGFLAACAGLLPHLVSGMRLPLQNLWQFDTLPDEMPLALLPISQYYLWLIVSLLVTGGLLAGLAKRWLSPVVTLRRWPIALAVLATHATAILQSFTALAKGLPLEGAPMDSLPALYFAAMLATTVAGTALAQLIYWLVSHRAVPRAAAGLALAAVPFVQWLIAMIQIPLGSLPGRLELLVPWLPAVAVGGALVWCGLSRGRAWVWATALIGLWLIPAVATTLQYVAGSRAILAMPSQIPDVLIRTGLGAAQAAAGPVCLAGAIGLVGAVVRSRVSKA